MFGFVVCSFFGFCLVCLVSGFFGWFVFLGFLVSLSLSVFVGLSSSCFSAPFKPICCPGFGHVVTVVGFWKDPGGTHTHTPVAQRVRESSTPFTIVLDPFIILILMHIVAPTSAM